MARSKISFLRASALILVAGGFTVFAPHAAQAGFDFKAPPKPVAAKDTLTPDLPPVVAVPSTKVEASDLNKLPVVDAPAAIDPNPHASLGANPALAASPLPPVVAEAPVAAPVVAPVEKSAPAPVAAVVSEPAATPASGLDVAQGFGSDIPLALAMRQIVPSQYAFSFDSSVDQGTKISWNGGKPWDEVLNDSLKPLGYAASVSDNTVRVAPAEKVAAAPVVVPVDAPAIVAEAKTPETPGIKPVLTAEAVSTAGAPAEAKQAVQEVYVRRSAEAKQSAAHTPAPPAQGKKPEIVADQNSVTLKSDAAPKEEKSFWAKANPANWGTASEVPKAGDKVAAVEPKAETKIDKKIEESTASEPVLLTRGPGEVSPGVSNTEKVEAKIQEESRMAEGKAEDAVKAAPVKTDTAVALDPGSVAFWQAEQGDSLKNVLQTWSATAKVQLYWVPAQDYKLPKAIRLEGSYTDAVATALGAYDDKKSRPIGRLHPNLPNGPAVLIIEPSSVSSSPSAS